MLSRRAWLTMLSALCVLGGAMSDTTPHPARAQTPQQITIQSYVFQPATLTIPVGTRVTWTNLDAVDHTATSDTGSALSWDSGPLAQGQSSSVTFTRPGTFTYHCNFHPFMMGTIVVQAAGTTTLPATAVPAVTAVPTATTVVPVAPTAAPVSRSRPKHTSITIKQGGGGYTFAPARVTVRVGTRVTWSNRTDAPHTVTGRGSWKFASRMVTRNHGVSFTFKKAGTYKYYCTIHPSMKGTIVVRR